jgi:prevent-host-death family protein
LRSSRTLVFVLRHCADEIVRKLGEHREPLVITQHGEAKIVLQDIESYEQTQESMALLKILVLGMRQIEEGKVLPAEDVISRLRSGADRENVFKPV